MKRDAFERTDIFKNVNLKIGLINREKGNSAQLELELGLNLAIDLM